MGQLLMERNLENIGQRIVEIARLATAMHLEEVLAGGDRSDSELSLEAATVGGATSQQVGGADQGAIAPQSRLMDETACFKDEASSSMDGANRRHTAGG